MCTIRRPKLSALWLGAVISGLAPKILHFVNGSDLKFVGRNLLEALRALHELGYVHTGKHLRRGRFSLSNYRTNNNYLPGVKPDNILVNYGNNSARLSEVQLGDCGDTYCVNPNADPDIWSFGTTVSR
jgi:hypothetical protein